jgi:hypothetical protein
MEELMKNKEPKEFISELCITPLHKVSSLMVVNERTLVEVLREK